MTSNRWERFAQVSAEYFIATRVGGLSDDAEFFASGQEEVATIVSELNAYGLTYGTVVDFGAGVGRLALPAARAFASVIAVDIAPTMLRKLEANARERSIGNIRTAAVNDEWLEHSEGVDAVYSLIVFQHIESFTDIARNVRRLSDALVTGGLGYLHFDTRRVWLGFRARALIPDFLLPTTWRRGIRRIPRSARAVRRLLVSAHFEILREHAPDSACHVFIVRRI
jgi:cyclopropane fatty-acyl-phospholipid synthase-like methyltransferase